MSFRVDVQEGDELTYRWLAYGDIKAQSATAPIGQYFLLRLPFYRYGIGHVWFDSAPKWWQQVLLYQRYMPKGREGQCGRWRVIEMPAP